MVDVVGLRTAGTTPGDARLGLTLAGASLHLSPLKVPPGPTAILAGVITAALAGLWLGTDLGKLAQAGRDRGVPGAVRVLVPLLGGVG